MRIKIELFSNPAVILGKGYNEYLQAVVYNHLNDKEANWLHENGFAFEKRQFRLFVLSSILEKGKFDKEKKLFTFPQNVSFYVSSPVNWILEQLAKNILSAKQVFLGNNRLSVISIAVMKPPDINSQNIKTKAISPIEVHSTLTKGDGKKKTYYYTPFEKEFPELINLNIKKKWKAFHKQDCSMDLKIKPLFNGNKFERIQYFGTGYSPTLIKAWAGYYRLEATPELLKFAIDAGLGARNSQGFGMVEMC